MATHHRPADVHPPVIRRALTCAAIVLAGLLASAVPSGAHRPVDPPAAAQVATTTTTAPTGTTRDLPGSALEAEERDDGSTSTAPWVIGSGIAALAVIGIGGTLLKRRTG